MKYIPVLLLAALSLFSSCRKLGICHDAEFSLQKAAYPGKELRTDGFYYGLGSNNGSGGINYHILIFYRNGIVYLPGVSDSAKMENYVSNLNGDHIKKVRYDWGVFNIDGTTIKAEHWPPAFTGCSEVELKTGQILNDTTFLFTSDEKRTRKGKTTTSEINETYHFRHYEYKPDSTNDVVE